MNTIVLLDYLVAAMRHLPFTRMYIFKIWFEQVKMEAHKQDLTLLDIKLAAIYYPMLIELAMQKRVMTYSDFVEESKSRHLEKEFVQNAFPLSIGRRLNAVWFFTEERALPDLTAILINKQKGEEGSSDYDKEMRKKVYDFDWSKIDHNFDFYVSDLKKAIAPRKTLKREQAKKLMRTFYVENKDKYPINIVDKREEIIALLMEGLSPESSFDEVCKND